MRADEFYSYETARRASAARPARSGAVLRPTPADIVRPAHPEIVRLPDGSAAVTGSLPEVSAALARFRRAGRLVGHTDPLPTGLPGQVMVTARLLPAQATVRIPAGRRPARQRRRWTRRRIAITAGVTAG